MDKDFEDFQNYFKQYQERFGLTDYKVYFKHEKIDGAFASITMSEETKVATVKLNKKCLKSEEPFQDIKLSAKHEALHLLLHKLEDAARYRFTREGEITETVEGLVHKLENLISD